MRKLTPKQLLYFGKGRKRRKPSLFGSKGKVVRRKRVARKPRNLGGASGLLKKGLGKIAAGLEQNLGGEEA